jgi:hypothetical protein
MEHVDDIGRTPVVEIMTKMSGPYIGVIVCHEEGVQYSNQSGCLACKHPAERGFYVPLRYQDGVIESRIPEYDLCGSQFGDHPAYRFEEAQRVIESADLDTLIEPRSDGEVMMEAWVEVSIRDNPDHWRIEDHLCGKDAVLVWENCD